MFVNGLLSIICATLIKMIEGPAQEERLAKRDEFLSSIDKMRDEIQQKIANMGTPG